MPTKLVKPEAHEVSVAHGVKNRRRFVVTKAESGEVAGASQSPIAKAFAYVAKYFPGVQAPQGAIEEAAEAFAAIEKAAVKTGMPSMGSTADCQNCCAEGCACTCHGTDQCCDACCSGMGSCGCGCHRPACAKCCAGPTGCRHYCHDSEDHTCSECCSGAAGCGCDCHAQMQGVTKAETEDHKAHEGGKPKKKKEDHQMPGTAGTPAQTPEAQQEAIQKAVEALLPSAIEKAVAPLKAENEALKGQLTEAVAKAVSESNLREEREAVAKAQIDMPHLVGATPAELGPILKAAKAALPAEQYEKLDQVLKASSEAISQGSLFQEIGSGGAQTPAAGGDVVADVTRKAEAICKAEAGVSLSAAMSRVFKAEPALYERYRKAAAVRVG